MSDSFQALKRNRTEGFDKLTQSLNKLNQKSSGPGPDERFWKPEVDKAGNGYAVIRFLPEPEGEDGNHTDEQHAEMARWNGRLQALMEKERARSN